MTQWNQHSERAAADVQPHTSNAHREANRKGSVVCRLDALLVVARRNNQIENLAELATLTGIDHRVLSDLERDRKGFFDASVLARLCAVFWGITAGTLLEYIPPPEPGTGKAGAVPPAKTVLTLPAFTLRTSLPEDYGGMRCLLRDRVVERSEAWSTAQGGKAHRLTYAELGQILRLNQETVSAWMNNRIKRFDRTILAQLCHVLAVPIEGLLRYVPSQVLLDQAPAPAEGT